METMIEQPQSMTDRAVQELSTFNDMISAVLHYGELTVAVDGIGKVEEAHKAVKKLNSSIEKKRVELKADALKYGKTVDSIAKQLSEKVDGIGDRHIEYISDIFALESNFQSVTVIPGTFADFARYIDIWQEVHFDFDSSISRTCFASTTWNIETKSPGHIATHFGFWRRRK